MCTGLSLLGGNPVLLADTPPALELIADNTDGRQSADSAVQPPAVSHPGRKLVRKGAEPMEVT